jgi:hypothetical protein
MPTSRVIVILYAFIATAYVMATARGPASLAWATAPLLMPLLAGVVIFAASEARRRPDVWLLVGLGSATVFDLVSPSLPAAGVAFLAVCHACYAIAFARARWVGLGVVVLLLSDVLLVVRLSNTVDLPALAVLVAIAYVVGQALIVTAWVRRPAGASPTVPRPRTEDEALTRR